MKATLKVAIAIAIVASIALLYRRRSSTADEATAIDTTTEDATTPPTADATGD